MFDKNGCSIYNQYEELVAHCKEKDGIYTIHANQGKCDVSVQGKHPLESKEEFVSVRNTEDRGRNKYVKNHQIGGSSVHNLSINMASNNEEDVTGEFLYQDIVGCLLSLVSKLIDG